MVKYRFKYIGLPVEQAIKWIDVGPEDTIKVVVENVRKVYKVLEGIGLVMMSGERLLNDTSRTLKSYSLDPTKDVISITQTHGGGSPNLTIGAKTIRSASLFPKEGKSAADERELYARQILLEGWRPETLKESTFLIAGVGALGCEIAKGLALMGSGKLILIDNDKIEVSNISRQMLYRIADRGREKVEVAAKRIKEMNPFVDVETHNSFIQHVPMSVYESADIVLGGLDTFSARADLNTICIRSKKPYVDGATLGFEGHVQIIIPQGIPRLKPTPCFRCVFDPLPSDEAIRAACTVRGDPRRREDCVIKAEHQFYLDHDRLPDLKDKLEATETKRIADRIAAQAKDPPFSTEQFSLEEIEKVLKNKIPAILTVNAAIANIQTHEALKIVFRLHGGDIGGVMDPPYLNYNAKTGIIDPVQYVIRSDCPACSERLTKVRLNQDATLASLFEGLTEMGLIKANEPKRFMITHDTKGNYIWNPESVMGNKLDSKLREVGVANHDALRLLGSNLLEKILVEFV